jgi:cell division protein FtsI/penicillin-binding protein 2
MGKQHSHGRLGLLTALLAVSLAALTYRLIDLQVLRHEQLRKEAQKNTIRAYVREPLRGQIRDIRGNLLATTVPAKRICANPTMIGDRREAVARALAPLLQTNEVWLVERLFPQVKDPDGNLRTRQHVVLKHKVSVETWQEVQKVMESLDFGVDEKKLPRAEQNFLRNLRKRAIYAEEDHLRYYPNNSLASHVVGYVSREQQQGLAGIEAYFNSKLEGTKGWRRTETDVRRRELMAYRDQDVDPKDGMNVVLTLDTGLQHIVETELAKGMAQFNPVSIGCVVVRPKTGEILAMAVTPTFDPNFYNQARQDAMRNRIISDILEPGSTFKIVVVSAALNEGEVTLQDRYFCENGRFYFASHNLHDHGRHGMLSVEGIITKSSNIGSAKIGIELGAERLHRYIRDFGFGTRTMIALPGEVGGTVHPLRTWRKISLAQIPMGHGVATTHLQMSMAMSAIANNGLLMRPMIVNRLEDSSGKVVLQNEPQPLRQVISPAAAKQMVAALKTVISSEGTALKAKLDNYTVAGKTGTAQKVTPDGRAYYHDRFHSSFIGFFPAEQPEICISIILDDPKGAHYGGQTAAPIFKAIGERAAHYLNLKPEIQPDPSTNSPMKTLAVHGRPLPPLSRN